MNRYPKSIIILLAVIFLLGSGTLVFAHRDKGYGYPGTMHHGQSRSHRGYGGPGYGMFGNLSEDEIKKLNEEHTAFWVATKDLQRQIYQKQLELASELAKQNPDTARASALQQELSAFQAQLAQKHLEHILRAQKINPDIGRGFRGYGPVGFGMMNYRRKHYGMMRPGGYGGWGRSYCPLAGSGGGYGMGSGMMHRDMMGPGGYGAWNCPWGCYGMGLGMMGPGSRYGMGQRMMGPGYGRGAGKIGPRGGRGMGSGMMNRDDSRQYHDDWVAPAEKNAGASEEN